MGWRTARVPSRGSRVKLGGLLDATVRYAALRKLPVHPPTYIQSTTFTPRPSADAAAHAVTVAVAVAVAVAAAQGRRHLLTPTGGLLRATMLPK